VIYSPETSRLPASFQLRTGPPEYKFLGPPQYKFPGWLSIVLKETPVFAGVNKRGARQ